MIPLAERESAEVITHMRIALVAFKFPPYDQVGARRWTKLSKYLAAQGVELDVVTTHWRPGSIGVEDVTHPNIHIHRVFCPGLHRLWVARFDRATLKGTIGWAFERTLTRYVRARPIAEEARYWSGAATKVERLLDTGKIDALVVTGGPLWAVHWAAQAHRCRPEVPMVIDYRDPLIATPPHRSRRELVHARMQLSALDSADAVVAVTEGLAEMIGQLFDRHVPVVIRNGCDLDEIPAESARTHPRPPVLLHAGNVFVGRERPLEMLLATLREHGPDLPDLRFVFYGGFPSHLARAYSDLTESGVVSVRERIAPDRLMAEIDDAFACLHFNAQESPFALSTKIYEYACAGRPTLSLNYGGEIESLITTHSLGWSARADSMEQVLDKLVAVQDSWRRDPSLALDPAVTADFSYARLSALWIELLESLRSA